MTNTQLSRRAFLSRSARWGAVAGLGLSFHSLPGVAAVGDYKALVCIQLLGGNDGNNLIVPLEPTPYAAYQAIRGNLALTGTELLAPIQDGAGNDYAFHYGLPEINNLFQSGQVAVLLNTGMLQQPLTRQQYQAGQGAPTNLFSHSDQTLQAFTGVPTPLGSGWAGRLLDLSAVGDSLAAVSVASPTLMLQGTQVAANIIPPGSDLGLWGMNMWPASAGQARRQALKDIAAMPGDNPVVEVANQTLADGIALSELLASSEGVADLTTVFPGTSIGNQLKQVTAMIRKRAALGPGRQVFYCTLEGFDTHSGQDWQHWSLLSQLSQAVAAFHQACGEAGLVNQVTTFTQSEFGRTLQPSGSGCDHGWGSHHLVIGGAVQGGIYGTMPVMALGGPDDANNRGVWIPTIANAQVGATLGKWFGATAQELEYVFPNLGNFAGTPFGADVGFMG